MEEGARMKTVQVSDETDLDALGSEIAGVIANGGLACLPCAGRYRIVADVTNGDAVMELMEAKRRVRTTPALLFVGGPRHLRQVSVDLDPLASELARTFWPRPLTIRVRPGDGIPQKVLKQLGGKRSRIGVRVPADPLAKVVVETADRPLLVSSANPEKKIGDSSPAQVRKNFGGKLNIFVDRGDLAPEPLSTVIDVVDGRLVVERTGAITTTDLAPYL
jgi:L-threonylcarbamoyladenylate synthase